MYEESGSENENVEENEKGENKKNTKESTYTNISSYEKGKQAEQQKIKKPKNHHEIPGYQVLEYRTVEGWPAFHNPLYSRQTATIKHKQMNKIIE